MSKIVRFHELGDADVLKIEDLPSAEPKPHEVRIDVEAIGLNRAEVMFRRGQYLEQPKLPSGLGKARSRRTFRQRRWWESLGSSDSPLIDYLPCA